MFLVIAVDLSPDTFFEQFDIEIDQKPDPFVGKF